jgi:hypothetical protein
LVGNVHEKTQTNVHANLFAPPAGRLMLKWVREKQPQPEENSVMIEINTLRKNSPSVLVETVDKILNEAHFAATLNSTQGFYAIDGMSGKKYRYFINTLVKNVNNAAYLEVGSWAGSTLCSAVHGNKVRAVAIDNWSQFGGPKDLFFSNLKSFMTAETRVHVIEGDFREVDYENIGIFNIYLFDGPHEEKDQYDGLAMAQNALEDEFVFIIDDWNWSQVRKGTMDAIRDCNLNVLYAAEIRTTLDNSHPRHANKDSDWHNGYYISVLSKAKTAT